jgi:hypothetical protein
LEGMLRVDLDLTVTLICSCFQVLSIMSIMSIMSICMNVYTSTPLLHLSARAL